MRTRGFTLIELLAVIVILAVIALIATPIILGLIDDTKKSAFKDSAYGISGSAKNTFVKMMYAGVEPIDIVFTYTNGVETSNPNGYTLDYEGEKPQNGEVILKKDGQVALALHNGKWCAKKSPVAAEVTVEEIILEECTILIDKSGADIPILAKGMTPVIWDADTSTWIEATNAADPYSQNWYNYKNKKWANARTADGSLWVWIPRYIYKISSGWHTATAGTIDVQFSQGTNDNWNSAVIGAIDTGATSDASNNKWTNHPAFKFGSTEMTGFWVAKFEASPPSDSACYASVNDTNCNIDTITPHSKPNAIVWRKLIVSNAFTATRKMETNSVYGWDLASGLKADGTFTTDGNGVDTHMMKNTEWGAVSYLTQSTYGANGNIAGDYTYSDDYLTGENYATTLSYSTTENIYGVYDMRANFEEIMAAYVSGYSTNLTNFGSVLTSANTKYVNVYNLGGSSSETNYPALTNYKGDAMWETSSVDSSGTSWYSSPSNTIYNSAPFPARGFYSSSGSIYAFHKTGGSATGGLSDVDTFRPVILVGTGL